MAVVTRRHSFADLLHIFDVEDAFARSRTVSHAHPRPFGRLRFFLTGQWVDGERRPFAPPLELIVRQNQSGHHLFFGIVKDASGEQRRLCLATEPPARYVVRIEGRYYAPAERQDIEIPAHDLKQVTRIELAPGYAYPFPAATDKAQRGPTLVRGQATNPQERGLADTNIQVVELPTLSYRTDQSGQWVLPFAEETLATLAQPVTIHFKRPNGASQSYPVTVIPGQDQTLPRVIFDS